MATDTLYDTLGCPARVAFTLRLLRSIRGGRYALGLRMDNLDAGEYYEDLKELDVRDGKRLSLLLPRLSTSITARGDCVQATLSPLLVFTKVGAEAGLIGCLPLRLRRCFGAFLQRHPFPGLTKRHDAVILALLSDQCS